MTDRASLPRLRDLLAAWREAGLVEPERIGEIESFVVASRHEPDLPLHLHVLAGLGAFVAAVCFVAFLAVAGIVSFDTHAGMIGWGATFAVLAVAMAAAVRGEADSIGRSFLLQSSLATMAIGKVLFVAGAVGAFDLEHHGLSLAFLLATLATWHLYARPVDRFLSSLATLFALSFDIGSGNLVDGEARRLAFDVFVLAEVAGVGLIFMRPEAERTLAPLGWALVVSLVATTLAFATDFAHELGSGGDAWDPRFVHAVFAAAIIGLVARIAGTPRHLTRWPLALAPVGTIVLAILSAPGILLAIGLAILGHARRERRLVALAALLLPTFLVLWYWNLDVDLMTKSGVMAGSGLVLLTGRALLRTAPTEGETP